MPTYEYRCEQCRHRYEKREGFDAPSVQPCPQCNGMARRIFYPPPIVFKGAGFYNTDNRRGAVVDGQRSADTAEAGAHDGHGTDHEKTSSTKTSATISETATTD